jgi:hypothetical protein
MHGFFLAPNCIINVETQMKSFKKMKNKKQVWFTITITTRKNCFRYLKLMSPLNAAICTTTYLERQKCYGPDKNILSKKPLFYLEVNGQGLTKVITVRGTPSYGHAPTYQISLTYLERQKCYGPDKKIIFKNNYLTLRSKVKMPRRSLRYTTHRHMVMHPHTKYH